MPTIRYNFMNVLNFIMSSFMHRIEEDIIATTVETVKT